MLATKSLRVKILPHTSALCKHHQRMNEGVVVTEITVQGTELLRLTAQFCIWHRVTYRSPLFTIFITRDKYCPATP